MRKMIYYFIFLCLIVLAIIYREDITNYVTNNIIKQEKEQKLKLNEYAKKKDYEYVKITNDFTINNRNEIRDIFYTIVDSGMDITMQSGEVVKESQINRLIEKYKDKYDNFYRQKDIFAGNNVKRRR